MHTYPDIDYMHYMPYMTYITSHAMPNEDNTVAEILVNDQGTCMTYIHVTDLDRVHMDTRITGYEPGRCTCLNAELEIKPVL